MSDYQCPGCAKMMAPTDGARLLMVTEPSLVSERVKEHGASCPFGGDPRDPTSVPDRNLNLPCPCPVVDGHRGLERVVAACEGCGADVYELRALLVQLEAYESRLKHG